MKINNYLFFVLIATIIFGCSDNGVEGDAMPNYLPSIDATSLLKANHPMTMFEDNESPSKMYDNTDRWFRVNQLVQVIPKGKDSIQLSLYSPVGLTNVKIYGKIAGFEKRILIYDFTKIPAFHRSFHQIPLTAGKNDYLFEDGKTITIDKMEGLDAAAIEFSVESNDALFAMFKKIKSSRLIQFSDSYHLNNPARYLPMNPVIAKEAITMIINYSYAISHPLYYDTFVNFDRYKRELATTNNTALEGAINWHGNAEDLSGVYDYLTKDQIDQVYATYIDNRKLYMAMVTGDNAWGGGPLASHWESNYINGHWRGNMSVWSHEYSHHSGYDHTSNLANNDDGGGLQEMLANFYKYLIYLNDLPFTDPDILKSWTKIHYLNGTYTKPVFTISSKNPFLLKYKGEGKWN